MPKSRKKSSSVLKEVRDSKYRQQVVPDKKKEIKNLLPMVFKDQKLAVLKIIFSLKIQKNRLSYKLDYNNYLKSFS